MTLEPDASTAAWAASQAKQDSPPLRSDPASRYRTVRVHSQGGLGVVFLAIDEELHREVALKKIKEPHADDPEARQRFVFEAEITGGLEHPGIVPVYGLGQDANGSPIYAMRFIRGESFKNAIAELHDPNKQASPREQSQRLRRLLGRFVAVCNAVAYAHSRGVVHRDLKPENIMLGEYGETLIVDWGLAKILSAALPGVGSDRPPSQAAPGKIGEATAHGTVMGTPAYMSPEQASGTLEVGPASDVYSLGATLFCLLTGKAPFTRDESNILDQVRAGKVPSIAALNPRAPAPLIAVCRKAMALEPANRYASATELADDIDRWLADEPLAVHRDSVLVRLGRWSRRHIVGVTLLGTFLFLLLTLLPPLLVVFGHPAGRGLLPGRLREAEDRQEGMNQLNQLSHAPHGHHDKDPATQPHDAKRFDWSRYADTGGKAIQIGFVYDNQKPEGVVQAMTQLLDKKPRQPAVLLERARAHLALSKTKEALADLDALDGLLDLGTIVEKSVLRSIALLAKGEPTHAERQLDYALTLDPLHAEALRQRARLRLAKGETAKAQEDANALVRAQPASASALRLRAEISEAAGSKSQAAADRQLAELLEGKMP